MYFEPTTRTITLSIAVVIIILTGIFLSKSEYPFGTVLLTIHKLLALTVVIIIGVAAYKSPSLAGANLAFIIISAVVYILSFVSGGIISAIENVPQIMVLMHRIMAWIAVLAMMLYTTKAVKI